MTLTFDEYDKLISLFEKINTDTYWPTVEQINMFEKDPERWLTYCIYNYEKGKEPVSNLEKYSKQNLLRFINRYLEIV